MLVGWASTIASSSRIKTDGVPVVVDANDLARLVAGHVESIIRSEA